MLQCQSQACSGSVIPLLGWLKLRLAGGQAWWTWPSALRQMARAPCAASAATSDCRWLPADTSYFPLDMPCEEAVTRGLAAHFLVVRLAFHVLGDVGLHDMRLPQDVLDFLAWGGHDVAGARLVRSQPREALQLHRTLAEVGVTNMETLVVEAG